MLNERASKRAKRRALARNVKEAAAVGVTFEPTILDDLLPLPNCKFQAPKLVIDFKKRKRK